jgi:preprotein translocase subunit YajC
MNMTLLQAATPAAGGGGMQLIIMMVAVFGIMYFLMIRPQQKRQKELMKFRQALQNGDKVITAGGIYGTIKEVKDTYVLLEIDRNVDIRVDKTMIMKDNTDMPQQQR